MTPCPGHSLLLGKPGPERSTGSFIAAGDPLVASVKHPS